LPAICGCHSSPAAGRSAPGPEALTARREPIECLAFLGVASVVAVAALAVFLGEVKCPRCHRRMERSSIVCPHCGRDLEPELWKRWI